MPSFFLSRCKSLFGLSGEKLATLFFLDWDTKPCFVRDSNVTYTVALGILVLLLISNAVASICFKRKTYIWDSFLVNPYSSRDSIISLLSIFMTTLIQ